MRQDPDVQVPSFKIRKTDNESIFERGYDNLKDEDFTNFSKAEAVNILEKIGADSSNDEDLRKPDERNKNTELANKHDSDGSNSPFNRSKHVSRNDGMEINVPLTEMLNDIANKRGISKLDEIKPRDMHGKAIDQLRNYAGFEEHHRDV